MLNLLFSDWQISDHRLDRFVVKKFLNGMRDGSVDLTAFPTIFEWCSSNPGVSQYLEFRLLPDAPASPSPVWKSYHAKVIFELGDLKSELETRLDEIRQNLEDLSTVRPVRPSDFDFDTPQSILLARTYAFACHQITRYQTALFTACFDSVSRRLDLISSLFDFYADHLTYGTLLCGVNATVFSTQLLDVRSSGLTTKLKYIESFAARIGNHVTSLPRAAWAVDFGSFFREVITEGIRRSAKDSFYTAPMPCEDSLGHYLFGPRRPLCQYIDAHCLRIGSTPPADFVRETNEMCKRLVPERTTLPLPEQSMALLLMSRAIFNRAYELSPECFARGRRRAWAEMLERLARIPADRFGMPWALIGDVDHGQPIGKLFVADKNFAAAAERMFLTIFQATPIDIIAEAYEALIAIKKAAIIHLSQSAGQQIAPGYMLPFDDLFVLLFGVLVASQNPDIDAVAWHANSYSERTVLAPPFEYALVSIEGLIAHCATVDIDALERTRNQ
jgi:hypothetical protein